jgi:protein-disulfide isomerase
MRFELAVPVNPTDHHLGASHAPVTVVEYGDFECPNCKQAAPAVKLLLARFTGKFWPMHDLLFDNQRHLKLPQLRGYAERLELDMVRYDADMADTVYLQRVREDIEGADASGVRATPTFFLNGVIQDVSYGLEALFKKVEAQLRR